MTRAIRDIIFTSTDIVSCPDIFSTSSHSVDRASVTLRQCRFVDLQITISVLRHEKPAEEYEVEIQKKSGRGAGICFAAFRSGKGAYVSELVSVLLYFFFFLVFRNLSR